MALADDPGWETGVGWMEGLEGDDAMTIGWYRDWAMSALLVFRERRPRYYILYIHQHNYRPLTQYHSYQSSESKPRSREYLLGSRYRFPTP